MASEIRVNSLTNRSGLSTVSITDAGLNAVGIITAHNFKTGTTNVHSTGVTAADGVFTGNVSVTGNLNVTGALTYEDVTNVDAVGLSTFRNGIHVTGGSVGIGTDNPTETLTLNHANGASIGLEYAGSEHGTLNVNSAAMYVRAGSGKHLILGSNGIEKLRIDSDGRLIGGSVTASNAWTGGDDLVIGNTTSGTRTGITLVSGNDADGGIYWSDGTGANVYRGQIVYNHTSDRFSFYTAAAERLRITSDGQIGMGIASPTQESGIGLHIRGADGGQSRIHLTNSATGDTATDGFYIISQGAESGGASGDVMFQQKENKPLKFATNNVERLRIGSGGGHKITCAEGYYAANLTECNDGRIALNINQTRSGQTKAIAIGAVSGNTVTGIQCYDTSNNSANNLILNPFGGNMGLGTNNPTSDGGTTFEIYDDNTPSIRLNDGNQYMGLFQLRGNDLEIRGSNGQLEFYTGNTDGALSSLRGAITSAGHKWTHNGSIFHGSNDVTDFTDASRATYNNVSLRSGRQNAGTSPTNENSAIKIYPAGVRSTTTGNLTGGIAWQHLDPNNSNWGTSFGSGSQIWMGAALHDTPGQERDRFNLWMNDQTTAGSNPNNLAIEAYPNGIVRFPKVPAFYAYTVSNSGLTSSGDQVFTHTRLNNGSCYSTSNGRFTAPIDGMYLVSTSVQLYGQGSGVSMSFRINGTDFHGGANTSQPVYDERAGSHDNLILTAVVSLSQNDYITTWTNNGIRGMQSYFTGHLVG